MVNRKMQKSDTNTSCTPLTTIDYFLVRAISSITEEIDRTECHLSLGPGMVAEGLIGDSGLVLESGTQSLLRETTTHTDQQGTSRITEITLEPDLESHTPTDPPTHAFT